MDTKKAVSPLRFSPYSRLFVFIRGFIHGFLRVDWRSFAVEEVGNRVAG